MVLTFKYRPLKRSDGSVVKSPVIPITLIGQSLRFDVIALLDSGADVSAIPYELADLLGISFRDKEAHDTEGIGGRAKSVECHMTVIVEDKKGRESYTLNMPVNVMLDEKEMPILLGRRGFFEQFVITFDEVNQRILLKRNQQ